MKNLWKITVGIKLNCKKSKKAHKSDKKQEQDPFATVIVLIYEPTVHNSCPSVFIFFYGLFVCNKFNQAFVQQTIYIENVSGENYETSVNKIFVRLLHQLYSLFHRKT